MLGKVARAKFSDTVTPLPQKNLERAPWGRKNRAKTPPPGQLFSNIQQKKQQNMNETEIMKNSTKMLICLKHIKAQSFLVGGFYEYSKYLKSFSIHL